MEENTVATNNTTEQENEQVQETFTRSQLDSEISKAVASALKRADKAKEKAIAEAQRVAQLSEEDRQKEYIHNLETEKAELEKKFKVMENTKVCLEECSKRGIPAELNDFIVCEDADDMIDRLNIFEKTLKKLVNEEVKKRLPSNMVETGNSTDNSKLTKESFRKLSIAEQTKIFNEDKDLYMSLIG